MSTKINFVDIVKNPEEIYKDSFNKLKRGIFFRVQIGATHKYRLFLVKEGGDFRDAEGNLYKSVIGLSEDFNKGFILMENEGPLELECYYYDDKDCISIIETGSKHEYIQEKTRWERLKQMWKWWRENRSLSDLFGDKYTLLYYDKDVLTHITYQKKEPLLDVISSKNLKVNTYLLLHGIEDV